MNDEDIRSLGEKGNPDYFTNPAEEAYPVKYIGEDKAVVQLHKEDELHWSEKREMGYKSQAPDFPSWYDSDNDARSPLEADLEDINEEVDCE